MNSIHRQLLFVLALTLSLLACVWEAPKVRAAGKGCPSGISCGTSNYYCSAVTMGYCNTCQSTYCIYNGVIGGSPRK